LARELVDTYLYQVLRSATGIRLIQRLTVLQVLDPYTVYLYDAIEPPAPENDCMVAFSSARGMGGFRRAVVDSGGYELEQYGKNHANIGDGATAPDLIEWLKAIEQGRGDLR